MKIEPCNESKRNHALEGIITGALAKFDAPGLPFSPNEIEYYGVKAWLSDAENSVMSIQVSAKPTDAAKPVSSSAHFNIVAEKLLDNPDEAVAFIGNFLQGGLLNQVYKYQRTMSRPNGPAGTDSYVN